MVTLSYQGDADLNAVQSEVESSLSMSDTTVQSGTDVSGNQTMTITLPDSQTLTTQQLDDLLADLNSQFPDNAFEQTSVSNVDATIGNSFFVKSLVAVAAACVLILIYIAFRFRKIGGWPAGCMAIVALLHDMFVVFAVFVVFRIPLNGNFIAAMLTILGYSINDTVVIYDRVRENSALYGKRMPLVDLVNLSINQSFARSLMTSVTTCVALAIICVVAVVFQIESIFTFAMPLMFGMVSGVYSTVCIASQLWLDWQNHKKALPRKKA